ncbi:MAG: hypothetical protein ACRDGK_01860, partial [Actinomycetota bacterium]
MSGRPARDVRLRRAAFTLTLGGLACSAPVVAEWLSAGKVAAGSSSGLAVIAAAAFAAASILFLGAGRTAGAVVALPAITIGALLDDPRTMAMLLLLAAPVAEVAAAVAAFGVSDPVLAIWGRAFGEIRSATARALGS